MGCDVCGKTGPTKTLNDAIGGGGIIRDVCPSCEAIADKLLDKFRRMAWVRTRKKLLAIRKQRLKFLPIAPHNINKKSGETK